MKSLSQLITKSIDLNLEEKVTSLPLEFSFLPVDIISKEFTKLNNPYEYRIHYLGPRYLNTQIMHKKCSYSDQSKLCVGTPDREIQKYQIDLKRICNSGFINEKLRTNHFYKAGVYYRAFQGMNPTLNFAQEYIFNGGFESGNLDCVVKFKEKQFDLFLRIDSNTRGHLQWFYFSIGNGNKKEKIKINICNISKPGTLYEGDMKPYTFSKKLHQNKGQTWSQQSELVTNPVFTEKLFNYNIIENRTSSKNYCFSFQYEFVYEQDEVFFAYCVPYTYSQMLNDINSLPQNFSKIYTLGRSLSGLEIPLLHISDHREESKLKKNVVITGRIHPGQSNGSHVLKGFLKYLCSNQKSALETLKLTNFFVVPMLNPDGVILGNSRCSGSGRDLNRMFLENDKQLFPEIHFLTKFVENFLKEQQIFMYFDFHGHSRKKNTFFYGPSYQISNPNYLKCRILPRIIEKLDNTFRYHSCTFSISQQKKSTGRALMFENFQIPFTYTIQSSIGLFYDSQLKKTFTFSPQLYQKMGLSIGEGACIFIKAFDEYQKFLKQRRANRESQRNNKSSLSKRTFTRNKSANGQQDESINQQILKITNKQREKEKDKEKDYLFVKLLEEVRKLPFSGAKNEENLDNDASSDDHDEKQDFQKTKMKEFNFLIIENAQQKQNGNNKNTIGESYFPERSQKKKKSKRSIHESLKNQNNFQEEQLDFFEQMNLKPQSSHSKKMRKSENWAFSKEAVFKKTYYNKEDEQKSPKKEKKTSQNEDQFLTVNLEPANSSNEKSIQKGRNFLRRSMVEKQKFEMKRNGRNTHFSQLHFPRDQKSEEKKLFRHQKTDLLRKNISRNKQREDKIFLQNLNCSELTIHKHSRPRGYSDFLESSSPTKLEQFSSAKISQFKMDDLMQSLQFHSKLVQQSVKFKDKQKPKTTLIFPSSFHGIRQQLNQKNRQHSFNSQKNNTKESLSLTTKHFYK